MTTQTEVRRAGEFLLDQGPSRLVFEAGTLTGAAYVAGLVMGQITTGTATAAAVAGGTGGGTLTLDATTPKLAGCQPGVYTVRCVLAAAGGGLFAVKDPKGVVIGLHPVGAAAFNTQLKFVIADGAPDFAVGDSFTITVAAGSGKWTAHDPAAVDGSDVAAGILYAAVDAATADAPGVLVRRLAAVNGDLLTWKTDIAAGDKAAGIAALATAFVQVQ